MKITEQKTNTVIRNSAKYQNLYYLKIPDSHNISGNSRFTIKRKFDSFIIGKNFVMALEVKVSNANGKITWSKNRIHQIHNLIEFCKRTIWPAIIIVEINSDVLTERAFKYAHVVDLIRPYGITSKTESLTVDIFSKEFKKLYKISRSKINLDAIALEWMEICQFKIRS